MKSQNLHQAISLYDELSLLKEDLRKFETVEKNSVRIVAVDGTGMNNYISVVVDSDELHKEVHNAIKNRIARVEKKLIDLGVEV